MTNTTLNTAPNAASTRRDIGIRRRYAAERRFQIYGIIAIAIGLFFLAALLFSVLANGYTAFWQTEISLPVKLDEKIIDPNNKRASDPKTLLTANYPLLVRNALAEKLVGRSEPKSGALTDVLALQSAEGSFGWDASADALARRTCADWSAIGGSVEASLKQKHATAPWERVRGTVLALCLMRRCTTERALWKRAYRKASAWLCAALDIDANTLESLLDDFTHAREPA